ncbi:hypothetical protein K3495_g2575 [Podosphaera aphanis]|nr:hypothetical protein K3495_g2575 [Podosphaera aphanis]
MIPKTVPIRLGRSALSSRVQVLHHRTLTTETTETSSHQDSENLVPLSQDYKNEPEDSPTPLKPGLKIIDQWMPEYMKKKGPDNYVVLKVAALKTTMKRHTAKLGAVSTPQYHPRETIWNPPKPRDVTLEMLMASQTHFGHHTSLWNPMNQRYIYGIRQGIHIISLEATATHLRRAAKIVEDVCYNGGIVLFVGTKKGHKDAVVKAAELSKGCHLFDRWQPGTITNGDQILKSCRVKVVDPLDQVIEGYEENLEEWKALRPDLVVCLNPLQNYVMLHECRTNNIPTIGIIDTNADPTWVTYPIPANDDSVRASQFIAGVLGRAGQAGNDRRLQSAKAGKVTWNTSSQLVEIIEKETEAQKEDFKRKGNAVKTSSQSIEAFVEPIRDPDWRIKAKADLDD